MTARPPAPRAAGRRKAPLLLSALLVSVLGALLALSALVDWPQSEPAARRMLSLRATELEPWLRLELLAPVERVAFAEPGGAADAADGWRSVLARLEELAANPEPSGLALPPLSEAGELAASLQAAIGARRFSAFSAPDLLALDEWLRGARVFATLLERAPSSQAAPIEPWLDAAIVLGSDLRSIGLLAPAHGAAELEEAVERRLAGADAPVDVDALRSIVVHALAAAASIAPPERVAERESRLAQAWACLRAGVALFPEPDGAAGFGEEEPPWPLVMAAAAVDRLETYDERLREVLVESPPEPARARYRAWRASFLRELPAAGGLVADFELLAPLREARARLERIRAAAQRRLER